MKKLLRNRLGKMKRYYGLGELDQKLEAWLDYDGGYFVELGANNGLKQSNTAYFEKSRGWTGVLVEPIPHLYLQCRQNRKKSRVFCCACVGFDYQNPFVEIEYADLMSVARGLPTDLKDIDRHLSDAESHMRDDEARFVFGAVARPLNALLEEAQSPPLIDLLSLDVEGAEVEVLRGIDFAKRRFRYMLIECRSIDVLEGFLNLHGYALEEQLSKHDYLFRDIASER